MEQLHVDDAGFVRAPASLVYRRLCDVEAWPNWWLGTRVRRATGPTADQTWLVELTGVRGRRLRYAMHLNSWRRDRGFLIDLSGDVEGVAEFWLESTHGGTVVHHILAGHTATPRPRRVLDDHRRAVRRGLWGCKDALQLEARTAVGLLP